MGSVRVLCVGRDEVDVGALEARDARFDVAVEPTVERALDRFEDWRPDCVVAARELPERSGTDLLAAVRERSETVPVLLLGRSERVAEAALAAGVTDVVSTDADGPDPAVLANRILNYTGRTRRRTELARYETVVDALGDPVYVLDDEGRFTYVNDAFLDFVGYDEATVLGATPDLIKDPDAVANAERQLGRLLSESGPETVTFEVPIRPNDGDPIRCEDHMGVLRGPDGEFRGSAGTLRDISERVERERRAREERQLLERSLDALDDVYYLLDPSGTIERCNERLAAVSGYDDPTGMDALEFFEGEDRERVAAAIGTAVESGAARVEAELVTADGRRLPYEFTGTRLLDDGGDLRGVIGVGRDVTERVAFETELERKNERLEEFVSVVSHDLRNPLNVAQGRVDLLGDGADEEHVEAIARSLDRMDALIDDLLTLAREGESLDDAEPVDLRTVVEASREPVETGGGTLEVRMDMMILADESRLRQLVENLLRNAVEHGSTSPASQAQQNTVEHGSTGSRPQADDADGASSVEPSVADDPDDAVEHGGPNVTVTVGTLDDGDGFYVADDGPGIPPSERERAFEYGYSTTREGTGFGLAIVESVASAHGWETTLVESEDGGARFEFRGVEVAD